MAASSSSMYMKKGLSVETYLKNETSLGAISTIYLKMVEGSKLPAVNSSDDGSVFTTLDTPRLLSRVKVRMPDTINMT